ncbi:MAG: peptidase S10 [Planctomycetota bacterium]
MSYRLFCVVVTTLVISSHAFADEAEKKVPKSGDPPAPVESTGTVAIDGKDVAYTVRAGFLPQRDDAGKQTATIFHTAYTVESDSPRPLTFCFNGGPGSASVWLHLGMLGPVRVDFPDDPVKPSPPFRLEPNDASLLDVTDLVFVDPVGTGFSDAEDPKNRKDFWGLEQDVTSVGRFIHDYLTEHDRWDSPLYLLGESYGTLRVSATADHLRREYNIEPSGLVLISAVLDFQTLRFDSDVAHVAFVPAYAATAAYHGKLAENPSPADAYAAAEKFAYGPYAAALLRGSSVSQKQLEKLADRMSALIGLPAETLVEHDLRVPMGLFAELLLDNEDRNVGRFDSRYTGLESAAPDGRADFDPSYEALAGPFTAGINQYLRADLGVETPDKYRVLGFVRGWDYGRFEGRYVNVAGRLERAMRQSPDLRVFVAAGLFDLATPPGGIRHTLDHLGPRSLRQRVTVETYPAGHMMYVDIGSLTKLRTDLVEFYDN